MATSKAKAKGKLKRNIGRFPKMKLGNKKSCETETASDLSQLRKPIDINLSSLRQIAQLFEKGTEEVREILTYECDVIYECRICRSLFRSLANLISHKRVYCQEKYSVKPRKYSMTPVDSGYYRNNNNINNSDREIAVDFDYKENCSNDRILRSRGTRKEPKKDLTSVVDMLMRKQNDDSSSDNIYNNETESNCPLRISSENEQVLLEMMDSNQAAYQTILQPQMSASGNNDLMKTQTTELKNMSNRSTAVLGPDGQFHEMYSSIPSYNGQDDNDDFDFDMNVSNSTPSEDLTCTTCNTKFATKKTLTFHVKCKHMPHRLGFPCPCCSSTFTNRWSVYRHLFKVHRKSNDQVRTLRSQIQARAMRRDTSKMERTTKLSEAALQKITEETQNLMIAQEWMENLELDTELQRCGACGKRFERKAALICHSEICNKRFEFGGRKESTARHKRARKNPPQRIGETIESSKDDSIISNETSSDVIPAELSSQTSNGQTINNFNAQEPPVITITSEGPKEQMEIGIRVEDVSSLSKDVWDRIGIDNFTSNPEAKEPIGSQSSSSVATNSVKSISERKTSLVIENSDIPEVIYTSIDNSKPVALSVLNKEQKLGIQYRGIRLPTVTLEKINVTCNRNDSASQKPAISLDLTVNESKTSQYDKKLSSIANFRKLQCLPCNRKFVSLINLRRHVAVHLRRSRYRCKLCDYRAFLKCECVAHCNKKHNARNNRGLLSELIIEMPLNNDLFDNAVDKNDELEVIDVSYENTMREVEKLVVNDKPEEEAEKEDEKKNNILTKDREICAIKNDCAVKVKQKRGRPPKSRRGRKKKVVKRNIVRKLRHVSPPKLNEDLSGIDEIVNSTESIDDKEFSTKSDEFSQFRAPSRMNSDPELRKMVMEVIFGSDEKQINENTENAKSNGNSLDEISIEMLGKNVLDHRENMSRLTNSKDEMIVSVESTTSQKIVTMEREDTRTECDQMNLTNNNFQNKLKSINLGQDITIERTSVMLGRKMSTNS